MISKDYYYTHFQTDFARFFSSLNRKGSLSRRRGSLLRIGVNTLAPQSDEYFSVYDFCIERRIDHLRDISSKNYIGCLIHYFMLSFVFVSIDSLQPMLLQQKFNINKS
jgi:hypothetical protein